MEEISVEEVQLWGEMTRETSAEQNATATREFISFLRTSRICESDEKNSIETNRRTMVYPQPKTDKTDLSV